MIISNDLKSELRQQLRSNIRQKRQQLSDQEQKEHAQGICLQLLKIPHYSSYTRITTYLANDSEISLDIFIKQLQQDNKSNYLPILDPNKKGYLQFMPCPHNIIEDDNEDVEGKEGGAKFFVENCYGIKEPIYDQNQSLLAQQLDVILLPLVAFDRKGNRLGMGGGYYDRSLAFLNEEQKNATKRPLLVGVAHSMQEVKQLNDEKWDIPVDFIATEKSLISIATTAET